MKPRRPHQLLSAALALTLLAALCDAAAQRGNTLGFGTARAGGKLLTRAELRDCLAAQAKLKDQRLEVDRVQTELDARRAELARLATELDGAAEALGAERAGIEAGPAAAVDAHNQRVRDHATRLAQLQRERENHNALLDGFNTRAGDFNVLQERWTAACAGRPYEAADLASIERGR